MDKPVSHVRVDTGKDKTDFPVETQAVENGT